MGLPGLHAGKRGRFPVVSKVEPIYNENVTVWSITLEAITKAAAEAGETGALPSFDAPGPDEGSSYYSYTGDMSPENHERMVAAVNADRARLAEVQDRLIRIDVRRRELVYLNFEGKDEVDPNDRDALLEEDLRLALEDAGAPFPTVEDHAQEKLAAEAGQPGEDPATEAGKTDEQDPPEDEEVGSFTLGKCKYCGREWGVTLEGAKGGGYPTQRTANAAATRVCNCPSARTARRIAEQIEDARERVNRLLGDGAEDLGFKPIAGDGALDLLEKVVELIVRGPISSATINVRGQCKAKFSITSKGKIKVSRSEIHSCDLEAGE